MWRKQLQKTISARYHVIDSFIDNLNEKYELNVCYQFLGIYRDMAKYIYCAPSKYFDKEFTNKLPKNVHIYIDTNNELLLESLMQKMNNEEYGKYKLTKIDKINLEHCLVCSKIKFENNDDEFIVYVHTNKFYGNKIVLFSEIRQDTCYLRGSFSIDKMIRCKNDKCGKEEILYFNNMCVLMSEHIEEIKEFMKKVVMVNVPAISIEKETECNITHFEPPYYCLQLKCNHLISMIAYINLKLSSVAQKCPICRAPLLVKYLNSEEKDKHIVTLLSGINNTDVINCIVNNIKSYKKTEKNGTILLERSDDMFELPYHEEHDHDHSDNEHSINESLPEDTCSDTSEDDYSESDDE